MLKYYDSHIEGGGSLTISKMESDNHRKVAMEYPEHYKHLAELTHDISEVRFVNDDKDEFILKNFLKINTRSFIVLKSAVIVIDERENILLGYDRFIISLVNSLRYNQLGSINNQELVKYLEYILENCQPADDISRRILINLRQKVSEKSSEAVES